MPIYEYGCQACGDVQEVMQKLDDPAPTDCPVCHKGPIVKMMSRTAFILKGAGWYATDFKDKGKPPVKIAKDGDGAPAKDAAGGDAKSAAKAEPKTEAPAASSDKSGSSTSEKASSGEKSGGSSGGCGTCSA